MKSGGHSWAFRAVPCLALLCTFCGGAAGSVTPADALRVVDEVMANAKLSSGPPMDHPGAHAIRKDPESYVAAVEEHLALPKSPDAMPKNPQGYKAVGLLHLLGPRHERRINIELFVEATRLQRKVFREADARAGQAPGGAALNPQQRDYVGHLAFVKWIVVQHFTMSRSGALVDYSLTVFDQDRGDGIQQALIEYYDRVNAVDALLRVLEEDLAQTPDAVKACKIFLTQRKLDGVHQARFDKWQRAHP